LEEAFAIDASRLEAFDAWEEDLNARGYWTAPEVVPATLDVDATASATTQLDQLDAWIKRYKTRTAGEFPRARGGRDEEPAPLV